MAQCSFQVRKKAKKFFPTLLSAPLLLLDSPPLGDKYESLIVESGYKVYMKLRIRNVSKEDFMEYKCLAKNSLGGSDGSITLYGLDLRNNFDFEWISGITGELCDYWLQRSHHLRRHPRQQQHRRARRRQRSGETQLWRRGGRTIPRTGKKVRGQIEMDQNPLTDFFLANFKVGGIGRTSVIWETVNLVTKGRLHSRLENIKVKRERYAPIELRRSMSHCV